MAKFKSNRKHSCAKSPSGISSTQSLHAIHPWENERTQVSILGYASELVEYRKGADATIRVYPTPLGLVVSAVNGHRLYTNNQWPNPVVLKIENVKYKPENEIIEQKSSIEGAK